MKIFYFTATGNSLYIAKTIGGELHSIPQVLRNGKTEFKDDAIGIVFPCYGFGLPRIIEEFIRSAKLEADYFFAVATYGEMSGACLRFLEKAAERANISFNYTNEILMVDNYIPLFDMDKQIKAEPQKNIEANLKKIAGDIKLRKNSLKRKNFFTKLISKFIYPVFMKKRDLIDNNFFVDDKCTKCGICGKVCPKGNIAIETKPEYLHKCDYCMACINLCPENAIHLKNEKSAARFKNANIMTEEIIKANNRI